MKYTFFLPLAFLLLPFFSSAQVPGCTDPQANNYNPAATFNDGSCTYNMTSYIPTLFANLQDEVAETSGIVFYNGGLWTHNDSFGEAAIYKIDTTNAEIVQKITISNALNVDWEDLSQDAEHIYIGDFGNNYGNRDDLRIYVLNKSTIPQSGDADITADIINFTYEDQKNFEEKNRANDYDCEAMIVVGNELYLFSKNWADEHTKLYALPKSPGTYVATKEFEYNIQGLVTGADYNSQFNEITLCGYRNNFWVPFIFLLYDYHDTEFFSGNKRRIDFPSVITSQTEGVCYYDEKRIFISAEKTKTLSQRLYKLNTGRWTNISPAAIELVLSEDIQFKIHPNPVKRKNFKIEIYDLPGDSFELKILNSSGRVISLMDYSFTSENQKMKIKIHVGDYEPGIYIVKLISGNNFATRKVIIQ